MTLWGIRVQLTVWYSLILALSLAAFGCVAYFAMDYGIRETLRSELSERSEGVRDIINDDGPKGRAALQDELKEYADGLGPGGLVRVADATGPLYASPGFESGVEPRNPARGNRPWRQTVRGAPFLGVRQNITAGGGTYDVSIAVAMGDLERALSRGSLLLVFSAPLFVAIAAFGGYWMARHALEPVDRITQTARSISAQNLSKRLEVPSARDELTRLADTLNQMLGRLEDAFRRVAQFTADASHELRTPIAVMRTSAELALVRPRTNEEYRDTLSEILRESHKVSEMLENLLTIARADSGAAFLKIERADLNDILKTAFAQTRILAEQKGVSVSLKAETPVWAAVEPSSVERLLMILLDNAVKYTPEGGHVEAGLHRQNGCAVVRVRDDGIGISSEDIPHIFDRFFRADRARSRAIPGAGLGLAIGKWIAECHGGDISVTSALGKGSEFEVRLPLSQG